MKKSVISLVIASTIILSACNNEEKSATNSSTPAVLSTLKEDAIAVVNGEYISKASFTQLEQELKQRSPNHSFPKEKLIEELIQRELLIQDAFSKNLDQSPEFIERLEAIKKSLLSQTAIQNFMKSNPVSDAELEAEYKKNISDTGTEYKARHILVKTEEDAKQLIVELDQGADFIALAKVKSTGPSGSQGGDLGWFNAAQMVAPFSEATIALEDGKYTIEPVQTQFGWHIILRESSRPITPPSFESVKEQIRPILQRKKMQEFMETLHKQAKVEIFMPKEEDKKEMAVKPATSTGDMNTDKAATTTSEQKKTMNTVTQSAKDIADKVTESVNNETKKATEKIESAVESTTKEAASMTNNAIAEIKNKVTETAATAKEEATKKTTEALDAVMP